MILTGNEFLGIQKKLLTTELPIFFPLNKIPDVETSLCNQFRKVISF